MKCVAVIPARLNSVRFNRKVLADIEGKPMIRHVWEQVRQAPSIDRVIIAVDDKEIFDIARSFGAEAILTSTSHPSGTDRIAEVAQKVVADVFINVQGDEPLVNPEMIDALAGAFNTPSIQMATLIKKIEQTEEITNPNIVKVVTDKEGFALYFSRSPIPFVRDGANGTPVYFKHIGMYAYRRDFLFTYTKLPPSFLEQKEKLEQLRVLENGYRIKTAETQYETVGVDTPQDLEKVRAILRGAALH
jgi:3-deoxy-manno-octulosonate cytidylyltransferase (CMP-KDO synthetase)